MVEPPTFVGCVLAVSVEKACLALDACEPFPPLKQLAPPAALTHDRMLKLFKGAHVGIDLSSMLGCAAD